MGKLQAKDYLLSVQHLFAMFGATVLVPLATGLNPAVALVSAGVGTLLFHLCTGGKVPVFLGSSFAFIAAISSAVAAKGIPYAQGGIMAAGVLYLVFALVAYGIGAQRIKKIFPPIVTGPIIIIIGLNLASEAIKDCFNRADISAGLSGEMGIYLLIALVTLTVVVVCNIWAKGVLKLLPILIGMAAGYLFCVVLHLCGVFAMDFSSIANAAWLNIPYHTEGFFTLPKFDWGIILSIAPIALVTLIEHIGDITTNGAVVGKNFFADPGLHRTLLGDGVATLVAGFFGGPANTTYSENTGVLATTKNYNPRLLRITAVLAIVLGFFGKFGAVLQTIPAPVKGGIEIMLFGMIASIGIRTLVDARTDFTNIKNQVVISLILVTGLGFSAIGGIPVFIGGVTIQVSGLFIATIVGVVLAAVIPDRVETEAEAEKNNGR